MDFVRGNTAKCVTVIASTKLTLSRRYYHHSPRLLIIILSLVTSLLTHTRNVVSKLPYHGTKREAICCIIGILIV